MLSIQVLALLAPLAVASAFGHISVDKIRRAGPPDVFEIKVPHLDPEDATWDHKHKLLYQSNLYRAKVSVSDVTGHLFDVHIPNISSDAATTPYELAGLSIDDPKNPTRLYGVAKDHSAFTFGPKQSKKGPNTFIALPLPLKSSTKPLWQLDLHPVQAEFEKQFGVWPFAPVDSTQDKHGNSYIVFALGAPAIAKVTPEGKASVFSFEQPVEAIPNRPGYTGIVYIEAANKLVAYGGPRLLTAFDLSSLTPGKPLPIKLVKQPSVKWGHAEKINAIESLDNSGVRLVATNAPYVYSFRSVGNDNWETVDFKQTSRPEFKNNSLTIVTEMEFGGGRQLYGAGAYFGNGKFNSRQAWPLYRVDDNLLRK